MVRIKAPGHLLGRGMALVSLLLCIGCLAMWMHSYFGNALGTARWSGVYRDSIIWTVVSEDGQVSMESRTEQLSRNGRRWCLQEELMWRPLLRRPFIGPSDWPQYGAASNTFPSGTITIRLLVIPYWLLFLGTSILPTIWVLLWLRKRHARPRGFPVGNVDFGQDA